MNILYLVHSGIGRVVKMEWVGMNAFYFHSPPPPQSIIESVMATADAHLQDKERLKLLRQRKKYIVTGAVIERDQGIGGLV